MGTGYTQQEAIGKNCRMLQGPLTEPRALSQLITAIRKHELCSVTITNVRKDGSAFPNHLSLHPVFDSTGVYRYNVAVLTDSDSGAPGSTLDLLRSAIPNTFDIER